ncbi:hypothetical protein K1719_012869 [Acacia pycnantha]|nr:hypothetical protein K1719_012869 [Acacia pycnantha]
MDGRSPPFIEKTRRKNKKVVSSMMPPDNPAFPLRPLLDLLFADIPISAEYSFFLPFIDWCSLRHTLIEFALDNS